MTQIQHSVTTEQLREWYLEEKKTTREVAALLGLSQPWARFLMKQRGIEMRKRTDYPPAVPKGTKFSEEHKEKISIALLGNTNGIDPATGRHRNNHRKEIQCVYCGKIVEKKRCQIAKYGEAYCGVRCLGKANGERLRGKANPRYTRVTTTCEYCGVAIVRVSALFARSRRHFCSYACNGKWKAENLVGAKIYNFKGGTANDRYYGEDWQRQKRLARERDNNTCQRCGKTRDKIGKNMDVHHIKPWRFFGLKNYKEANDLKNLICYCYKCHKTVEEQSERELF